MTIEVRVANNDDLEKWDQLVNDSPHGTIFHTIKWLVIAEKHTKSKLYPLIGFKGNKIVGIFPIFYQKKFGQKLVFSPPPHTAIPYLGPILIDYDNLKQSKKESIFTEFQEKVDEFINTNIKPNYVLIKLVPWILDSRPFKWNGYKVEPIYTYFINLNDGLDNVWKQFKKQLRKNINNAKNANIYVRDGFQDDLGHIYNDLLKRYKEQDRILSISKKYISDLYDSFYPKNFRLFVAENNKEFLSGIIVVIYKDKLSIWIGASTTKLKGLYPNDLLQWEIIKWANSNGLQYCEIIGANNPKISYFKSRFNPRLEVYFSAKKSSFLVKCYENFYLRVIKPIKTRTTIFR